MRRITILIPCAIVGIYRAAGQRKITDQRHFGGVHRNIRGAYTTNGPQNALTSKPEKQIFGERENNHHFQCDNSNYMVQLETTLTFF